MQITGIVQEIIVMPDYPGMAIVSLQTDVAENPPYIGSFATRPNDAGVPGNVGCDGAFVDDSGFWAWYLQLPPKSTITCVLHPNADGISRVTEFFSKPQG